MIIRHARDAECDSLLALWERSVRATHDFLSDADVAFYRPLMAAWLGGGAPELWVLASAADVPLGFLGLVGGHIGALFLTPEARGRGGGRRLVTHAQALRGGALTLEVDERNGAARAFYERLGFAVVGRSELDWAGQPYPSLHMRCPPPSADAEARAGT
jgi:putative acetyltransferase